MRTIAKLLIPVLSLGVAAACSPSVPDSGAGIGFDNSLDAQRARDAALANGQTVTGEPLIPPSAVSSETLGPAQTASAAPNPPLSGIGAPAGSLPTTPIVEPSPTVAGGGSSDDIARETAAALAAAEANSGVQPVQASPSNPAPGSNAISDENDFAAVSSRETIQSDAERIARTREQREQVEPTALPPRAGNGSPNVVAYALSATNPVGARVYSRTGLNLAAKATRNCGRYPSADQAQIAFLEGGGPQRDRLGLDPDGDGYACGWDPTPFRQAVRN